MLTLRLYRIYEKSFITKANRSVSRLISVVDVVGPMNPYQPIPFHILSFAVFQSRILIYAGSTSDSRREKYLRGIWLFRDIDQYERKCIQKKNPISSDLISLLGELKQLGRERRAYLVAYFTAG